MSAPTLYDLETGAHAQLRGLDAERLTRPIYWDPFDDRPLPTNLAIRFDFSERMSGAFTVGTKRRLMIKLTDGSSLEFLADVLRAGEVGIDLYVTGEVIFVRNVAETRDAIPASADCGPNGREG